MTIRFSPLRWGPLVVAGLVAAACSGAGSPEAEVATETDAVTADVASATGGTRKGEIVGQVVDVSCFLAQGLHGESHRQCAEICSNDLGIPLNVLDDQGNLWQLVDDDMPGSDQNPTVVQFAEQRVRATGTLIEKGSNRAIIVENVALVEGTANPRALEGSRDPDLGRTFNQPQAAATNPGAAAKPGAAKTRATNPCAANPCAANPCAANPCAANPCAANPCAANPCAGANPCAANPCAGA